MKKYLYYPGCSLRGTGKAYEESLLAVYKVLGVEMEELEDWNCCGATAYMSTDEYEAFALAGRNLAIADQTELDLLAPCSACYLVLQKTQHYIQEYPHIARRLAKAFQNVGLNYKGTTKVRHPLDMLVNDVGLDQIKSKVKNPLKGLKVAPYYGCQIVRPYATFDLMYYPVSMDKILRACGAEVVDYPLKTRCCGGSQKGTLPEVGLSLIHILLKEAARRNAEVVSTVCPLCQFNLDAFQDEAARKYGDIKMPVVYFTQLMGLALGVPAGDLGLDRNIVPADKVIEKCEFVHAA
ncbi:MAG TPA: CoB--CoM heterodisulfide reductase iron-sulfur subunit B family protein [Terriglobia bacterium]|nr:CoB--CoM heterodisulfide reductase iron-sulfur subunit B family protein [Terriglobia bacterium]